MRHLLARRLALALVALWLGAAKPPPDATVRIDNFRFIPSELSIPAGTTVVWSNRDDIPHTVTRTDGPEKFASSALDTDGQFSRRFDHAGRFAYFCSLHPHMQGVVIVR